MSPGSDLRVLLVGAGTRGGTWARVVAQTEGVELVGIVDTDGERAGRLAGGLGADVRHDTELAAALAALEPQGAIIASPPETHHALVIQALAGGIHVLCEKPLSEDMAEVIDMVARADDCGLHLMVGMNFRYLSSSQRIRRYTETGELGALSHAQFSYLRHRAGTRTDLNDYPMEMPYPMLLEQSIHHFDLMRYCYDAEVESLVADSWRPSWSTYDGDCCVSVLFRLEGGARINYVGTWTGSWNRMSFSWRSDFEAGALIQRGQFDDLVRVEFRPDLGLSGPRFKDETDAEPALAEPLEPCVPFIDDTGSLLGEFKRAVLGEAAPITTGRDHLKSLGLVQACIESVETNRWIDVAEFYRELGTRSVSRLKSP